MCVWVCVSVCVCVCERVFAMCMIYNQITNYLRKNISINRNKQNCLLPQQKQVKINDLFMETTKVININHASAYTSFYGLWWYTRICHKSSKRFFYTKKSADNDIEYCVMRICHRVLSEVPRRFLSVARQTTGEYYLIRRRPLHWRAGHAGRDDTEAAANCIF